MALYDYVLLLMHNQLIFSATYINMAEVTN